MPLLAHPFIKPRWPFSLRPRGRGCKKPILFPPKALGTFEALAGWQGSSLALGLHSSTVPGSIEWQGTHPCSPWNGSHPAHVLGVPHSPAGSRLSNHKNAPIPPHTHGHVRATPREACNGLLLNATSDVTSTCLHTSPYPWVLAPSTSTLTHQSHIFQCSLPLCFHQDDCPANCDFSVLIPVLLPHTVQLRKCHQYTHTHAAFSPGSHQVCTHWGPQTAAHPCPRPSGAWANMAACTMLTPAPIPSYLTRDDDPKRGSWH